MGILGSAVVATRFEKLGDWAEHQERLCRRALIWSAVNHS